MQNSNALTASALALGLLSFTLTNAPLKTPLEFLLYPPDAVYQTTSVDIMANKYARGYCYSPELTPREEALGLFESQTYYSDDELITYWRALEIKAVDTGVNLFGLL